MLMTDDSHGPNHAGTGCPTCDLQGVQPPGENPPLATVKLTARSEDFSRCPIARTTPGMCEAAWELLLRLGREGPHAVRSANPLGRRMGASKNSQSSSLDIHRLPGPLCGRQQRAAGAP